MSSICFTGHRPDKLYGYTSDIRYKKLKEVTRELYKKIIDEHRIVYAYTGGALGFDFMCFQLGEELKKDYAFSNVLCLPCESQGNNWHSSSKQKLELYKQQADKVHYVDKILHNENDSIGKKLMDRNKFMVIMSDIVIACWDGNKYGGTYNCIKFARECNRRIYIINPHTFEITRDLERG